MIGLVIGGLASGVGKTTVTLGLIGALRRRGLSVQPFKVGPDYIDPSQHAQVAGRPSRNLDSWLLPHAHLQGLFARATQNVDAAIVEGVMGLFDGRTGEGEGGSTAQVARLLGLRVLLVVDASKAGRSVAAAVAGCRALDPGLEIVGVVLNRVSGERHAEIGREAIEELTGIPVLGWLPRDAELTQEERYLGLVPAAERRLPEMLIERATSVVERQIDVERLVRLSERPVHIGAPNSLFPAAPVPTRARIAIAQDAAFNFYYQDNLDLLAAWGAELVPFSPLCDPALPADISGIYIGGGFPELFAGELAANTAMLASVRAVAAAGLPIYAECGGLMYLQERLMDADGLPSQMCGVVPGESRLLGSRLTLGYREVRARQETPLLRAGQAARGHEFHWSVSSPPAPGLAAYEVTSQNGRLEGYARGNVLASYVHLHFGTDASLAPRFVEACAQARTLSPAPVVPPPDPDAPRHQVAPGPLLREHGLPAAEIEALSAQRIEERFGAALPASEPERSLVARLVYAAGDPALVDLVQVSPGAIEAAVDALANGADLIVDVGMVAAGVGEASVRALGGELIVALRAAGAAEIAARHGVTRSAAGMLGLADRLDGAVIAIGNAPTALLALLDLVAAGVARPAAVIGMPVGFVAADESKALLSASDLPSIVVRGTRGGSPLAAATANHLLRLARTRHDAASLLGSSSR